MKRTVLILGARGRVGWALAQAFAKAGWEVAAHSRRLTDAANQSLPGLRWISGDVADTVALCAASQGASVVVHAMNPAYTAQAWRREAPQLMAAAISAATRLGALLMFPGNVYNFGQNMPCQLKADTPQVPTTEQGRIRLALEAQMAQAAEEQGLNAVTLRAGDFFGSGSGTWLDMAMVKDFAKGRFTYPGPMDVRKAWAYLPDLAATFVRVAAALPANPKGKYLALNFAGHTVSGADWLSAFNAYAPQPLKAGGLPWLLIRLLSPFKPDWAALVAMRYLWQVPHALDNSGLVALIGAEPHTPFPTAVAQAMNALGLLPLRPAGTHGSARQSTDGGVSTPHAFQSLPHMV